MRLKRKFVDRRIGEKVRDRQTIRLEDKEEDPENSSEEAKQRRDGKR